MHLEWSFILNPDDVTYQAVVEAMRFAFMAQTDLHQRMRLVELFLECAPEDATNAGFELLTRLLAEGTLRLEVVS